MTGRLLATLLGVAGAAGLVLSLVFTPLAIRVARRLDFVDHPGGHKSHADATPYGGGSAIFLAGWLPAIIALALVAATSGDWIVQIAGEWIRPYLGGLRSRAVPTLVILAGGVALHVLGLIDDLRPVGALPKLAVMTIVGLVVSLVGGVRIAEFLGPAASVILTTLWIVTITNAFNFLDNMDGLSAGVASICTAFLVICGVMAGQVLAPGLACIFLGALLGFLVFNFPPARIFMGDAGSLLVGYMIAVIAVLTSYYRSGADQPPYALAMPLIVLAIPLYDCASVVTIRLREGRNPMQGDRRHFSHRLVDHGLSRRSAVLTIYLATAATGLGATLLPNAGLREAATVASFVIMVLLIVAILESPPRKTP